MDDLHVSCLAHPTICVWLLISTDLTNHVKCVQQLFTLTVFFSLVTGLMNSPAAAMCVCVCVCVCTQEEDKLTETVFVCAKISRYLS